MYLDEVILSGAVIIVVMLGLSGYVLHYAIKHIKQDIKDHPGE